ncbi:MAG: hypothetical protein WAW85_15675 [Gordonia sp. (in: high G+C Gram-positive bacteria)]|uniref:hypothetical protein n=1 Tax=Gordonia sp. (in: high G+C Gram-positive bacteria) TaxID=84139 RepID=UPI003BB504F4
MTSPSHALAAENFSFGRLIARALGAAAAVLLAAVPIVWLLAAEHPSAALGVAIGAVVLMLVAMAVVARRELRHVQYEIDRLTQQQRTDQGKQ